MTDSVGTWDDYLDRNDPDRLARAARKREAEEDILAWIRGMDAFLLENPNFFRENS